MINFILALLGFALLVVFGGAIFMPWVGKFIEWVTDWQQPWNQMYENYVEWVRRL